jgi:hypothetical protein
MHLHLHDKYISLQIILDLIAVLLIGLCNFVLLKGRFRICEYTLQCFEYLLGVFSSWSIQDMSHGDEEVSRWPVYPTGSNMPPV